MTLPRHMLRSTAYDLADAFDVHELYQQKDGRMACLSCRLRRNALSNVSRRRVWQLRT